MSNFGGWRVFADMNMRCCVAVAAVWTAFGQTPAFEVVSVKPCTPDQQAQLGIGLFTYPGGRIRATNYTLRMLIHDAYGVEMHQILGGPAWLDSERWVVEAKPPESSESSKWTPASPKTAPNPEMREMLQTLLADQTFNGENATIDQLAYRLAQHLRRPVTNKTGIEGHFDFRIEYSGADSQTTAPPLDRTYA